MKSLMCLGMMVVLASLTQGCIILPIPNQSVDAYGVESQVVDVETRKPVRMRRSIRPMRIPPSLPTPPAASGLIA